MYTNNSTCSCVAINNSMTFVCDSNDSNIGS